MQLHFEYKNQFPADVFSIHLYSWGKKKSKQAALECISRSYLWKNLSPSYTLKADNGNSITLMIPVANLYFVLIVCVPISAREMQKGSNQSSYVFLYFWRQKSSHERLPQTLLQFLEMCGETLQTHELGEDLFHWGEGAISDHEKIKHR